MDRNLIRACLWQRIIKMFFSPASKSDQKNWLLQYGRSLKSFWGIETYPRNPVEACGKYTATIDSSISLGIIYEYSIVNFQKFSIDLLHAPPINEKQLLWQHEMDGQYFNFSSHYSIEEKEFKQLAKKIETEDLNIIVNSLVIHPSPHQHIKSPIDNHEIRIGGGIYNPYLYLFHLRVQLCPDKRMRDAEKVRLAALFEDAVRNDKIPSINDLMKIPNIS
ncbi:MAG: hypothetical protein HQM10_26085 [Candidatus Riflebacteria bacterium]|nr:hypothetical protein [Candidatus Riflebacteria bacterium]